MVRVQETHELAFAIYIASCRDPEGILDARSNTRRENRSIPELCKHSIPEFSSGERLPGDLFILPFYLQSYPWD